MAPQISGGQCLYSSWGSSMREKIVGVDAVIVAGNGSDGKSERLALLFEDGHDLLRVCRMGRGIGHHVLDLKFLQRKQEAGFARKVAAASSGVIRIIGMVVAFPDPDRLAGQLFRRLQVVGIELSGNDVIVRIQGRSLLVGLGGFFSPLRIALVDDVAGTNGGDCNRQSQRQLDFLLRFCSHSSQIMVLRSRPTANTEPSGKCKILMCAPIVLRAPDFEEKPWLLLPRTRS